MMKDDYLNIGFIGLSALLAYLLPFELMLFSYVFLGPAHYLTQIPWMHKRSYFLDNRIDSFPLIGVTLLMLIFPNHYQNLIAVALVTAIVLVLFKRWWIRIIFTSLVSVGAVLYQDRYGPNLFLFFLPTLVHVFLLTGIFIIHGAIKRKSIPAFLSLILLVGVAISFFVFPDISSSYTASELFEGNMSFFSDDIQELVKVFGFSDSWGYIVASARFVAFAYTYHYLNWFSKTETIGWYKIPQKSLWIVVALYTLFVGIYLYDFKTGLKALMFLSLLHVILELPLNVVTFKSFFRKNSPSIS